MEVTIKTIEQKLNEGYTTLQLAEHYQMTEKEFLSSLDKLSPVKNYIDGIKRRLSKNDKRFRTNSTNTISPNSEQSKVESLTIETANTSFTEKVSFDELIKRKEELIASIKKSEDFISKTPSYVAHIEEQIIKENERHQVYLAGYKEKIEKAYIRQTSIAQSIQKNSEELEKILQKIDSISNINVIVTANGEILIENDCISIPKGWQDVCFDIMRNDHFKDLEIPELKILAKLWHLTHSEENLSKKIKISFESSELEKYFELLHEIKHQNKA